MPTWGIVGKAVDLCLSIALFKVWCLPAPLHLRQMHTPNFYVYLLLTISFVWWTLFHECALVRSRFRILPHNQLTIAHMLHLRHNGEGHRSFSVECTPPTLVSSSSSTSPLSAKLCSMSVHRSVHDLELYRIISSLKPICYTWGIVGRTVDLCPSNAHLQLWCLPAPHHPFCLLNFVPWVCIDPFTM